VVLLEASRLVLKVLQAEPQVAHLPVAAYRQRLLLRHYMQK
jgi:hypothetical protein